MIIVLVDDECRVMNPNYRNSAAVYSTYFTGQFVSNFAGKPVTSDNLFNQFQLSGKSIQHVAHLRLHC